MQSYYYPLKLTLGETKSLIQEQRKKKELNDSLGL